MNEFLSFIAQTIPKGALIFFNQSLDIIFAEGVALQSLSSYAPITKGKKLVEVFSPKALIELVPVINQTLSGESLELQFQSPEDHYHTYWLGLKPIKNRHGQVSWGLISIVEVTEVQDIQLRLVNAKFELELKHRALKNMLNILRHDIKAPLASISNICHLGQLESTPEKSHQLFEWIQKIAGEALHFTQDLLDKKYLPILFEDLFEDIQERLRFHQYIAKVEFRCEVLGQNTYYGNKVHIISLLENLTLNSLNYHDLKKPQPYIQLKISYQEKGVQLVFEDNGAGISLQNLPYIFESAYRSGSKGSGSGIGLNIVKEIVDGLDGQIQIESTPGQGTRFEIFLGAAIRSKNAALA